MLNLEARPSLAEKIGELRGKLGRLFRGEKVTKLHYMQDQQTPVAALGFPPGLLEGLPSAGTATYRNESGLLGRIRGKDGYLLVPGSVKLIETNR